MRLLHLISTVDPRGGGPMEGLLQSALACVALGHEVEVATLDDPAAPFVQDYPIRVHALGPIRNGYGYSRRYVPWLRAHAAEFGAVIVNGLWQFHSVGAWWVLRDLDVPYFVFTHGMLDPWFKKAHPLRHLRKWLYWPWAEYRLLRDARAVLFTCEEERLRARESFARYRAREVVVTFGAATPPVGAPSYRAAFLGRYPQLQGRRLLLFLGRLHMKKGCDLLIDAFARVAREHPQLTLVLAGPDTSNWQGALQSQAARLGIEDQVCWPGMLKGDLKWGAFLASEAFVLPSHQENFGIAVAEALGCARPVLISDKVNIWREVSDAGAGLVASDTVEGTERCLRRWLDATPDQRAVMGARARDLFHRRFTVEAMAKSLIDVVQWRGPMAPAPAPELAPSAPWH